MKEGQIVIVVDTSNYVDSYSEKVPFKAELTLVTDYPSYWVRGLESGKEYELYIYQILEGSTDEEIRSIVDVTKY